MTIYQNPKRAGMDGRSSTADAGSRTVLYYNEQGTCATSSTSDSFHCRTFKGAAHNTPIERKDFMTEKQR